MATGEVSLSFNPVPGVRLAATAAGVRADGRDDLVLMAFAEGSVTAAVYTKSLFAAAPVQVGRRHLAAALPRYFLINSGNANAAVGEGVGDALACCEQLAALAGVRVEEVIPFSTGVIGERLPVKKITAGLETLLDTLAEDNWLSAARGIMTTDTRPKIASRQFSLAGETITLTGIAKGAGMIQPDMATMLCYIATDVACGRDSLQALLADATNRSFNRITVDSDTSTNDSCMLVATGTSGVNLDDDENLRREFAGPLNELCLELAQGIIRDAEGATRFVEVNVVNGRSADDCLKIAYAIANSPLMKTAIYAGDANWGRIVMAIGKAGVETDVSKMDIWLGDVCLMRGGEKDRDYTEEAGSKAMADEDIVITVDLNAGDAAETVWTSDLSHEYVRINAEYRT